MASDIYNVAKIVHHPEALQALREGRPQAPILVQLFVTNTCNQACEFCSYGSGPESVRAKVENPDKALWKNQQLFGGRDVMPREKMLETVACLQAMGVKALEVSGGGEPTAYPHFNELLRAVADTPIEFGLVTNGTLLTQKDLAVMPPFVWARVSIDAGTMEDYVAIRHTPAGHWARAWGAVEALAAAKRHPEAAVGVGFVIDRTNWRHIYDGCRLARDHGADNVRISLSFTPDGSKRWGQEVLSSVAEQLTLAQKHFASERFRINDLSGERAHNVVVGRQEYPFCGWKEVGCVIGADQNVYSCCSFAYNQLGLMGSIANQSFQDMWFGDGATWRKQHDPRSDCRIHCLYEKRNMVMLNAMGDRRYVEAELQKPVPAHRNFV